MENEEAMEKQDSGSRRKTLFQSESLEHFYSERKFPSQEAMEQYATSLNLTYEQVRRWFCQRRMKEKKETGNVLGSTGETVRGGGLDSTTSRKAGNRKNTQCSLARRRRKSKSSSVRSQDEDIELDWSNEECAEREDRLAKCKQRKQFFHVQDILSTDHILKKVFRKDGPPLGVEFDSLPAGTFGCMSGAKHSNLSCHDTQRCTKRRKVPKLPAVLDSRNGLKKDVPGRKHGMGKGLMTVWRATNPDAKGLPTGLNFVYEKVTNPFNATSNCHHSYQKLRKSQSQMLAVKQQKLGKKVLEKRKPPVRKRRVGSNNPVKRKPSKAGCRIALEHLRLHELSNAVTGLMDDEELELRELQAGPNPLSCSAHLQMNGMHGCSLCKDLLARFPPQSVKMKQPFCGRPWELEIVKKFFQVFRFLYTHANTIDVDPFTFDELIQAFHDKDSALLGKIHVAILELLLSDVERELSSGMLPRACKDSRYLQFLQFISCQEFNVQFWNTCLNSLTWTEIMRQILIASGFGIKQSSLRRQMLIKERNRMARFGLRHGTLKGELFNILFEQGSKGSKISDLAKSPQIVGLNLLNTVEEVEELISTTLSSDLTLFEKISSCAYRLRLNPIVSKGIEKHLSESDDSGSVNDDSDSETNSNSDDSEDSEGVISGPENRIIKHKSRRRQNSCQQTEATEIDESHSGEVWMLGLMEGEYSDLSLDEKLNALVALIDLTSSIPCLRIEDPANVNMNSNPIIRPHGSGAKIKRSTINKEISLKPSWDHVGHMHNMKQMQRHASNSRDESEACTHSLQSIYLGSDRRYNSYWLFLGPCNENDPGHRRVYFESSEDGHWEIIDSQEALCALLTILDSRGTREAHLLASLERCEASLCQVMTTHMTVVKDAVQISRSDLHVADSNDGNGSSPVSDVDNSVLLSECTNDTSVPSGTMILELERKGEEKRQKWDRLQEFDSWLWDAFYSKLSAVKYGKRSFIESLKRCESCHDLYWRNEKHCKTCHSTFELDFDLEERYAVHVATCREKGESDDFPKHKVLPSKLQSLKAAAHAVEAAMPEGSLVTAWTKSAHKLWVKRLRRTSSLPELLQVLTDFAGVISEEWLSKKLIEMGPNTAYEEIVVFFPTIPQTASSVALWLVKLDSVIATDLEKNQTENSEKSMGSEPRVTGRYLLRRQ